MCIDNVLQYIQVNANIISIVYTCMPAHTGDLKIALPSLYSHFKKTLLIYNQSPKKSDK
jgi:hypothetical protein